jgi:phospholipid-binding lipoprotein MlaA
LHPVYHRNRTFGLNLIHQRASFLRAEDAIFGDRYIFFRDAYLQRRNYLVNDGQVADDFDDF